MPSNIFKAENFIRYHRYHIEYKKSYHEVVCPEYALEGDSSVVVVAWYIIPGRPYPIQVYLFASDLYSSNPEYGQRAVAKATQDEFNLKTFSHSTVSRSFMGLEQSRKQELERRFGKEFQPDNEQAPDKAQASICADAQEEPPAVRRFPSVEDTAARRAGMAAFLSEFHDAVEKGSIESAGKLFVRQWYDKTRRLLI